MDQKCQLVASRLWKSSLIDNDALMIHLQFFALEVGGLFKLNWVFDVVKETGVLCELYLVNLYGLDRIGDGFYCRMILHEKSHHLILSSGTSLLVYRRIIIV